ncbi:hypothetical protein SLUN_11055 [Streptomyces lunaelactis]|uniref:Lipoprotein n=1 Tax=Streptomyces lunaelactis TaxID=1535768 RepID=A0A2R4T0L6_9ACTN|nr:hypothetical protein [Streptomyces lunaelactis]AVZ72651.1 hypothetical protein SLUN_11055 [Streptomyces lunaelactis]NUK03725.1 hypothetical protein [Streptomyces lunaelactis]NUK11497.1 hypothetical protein [Streptomyces lunaelactis]NUK18190.1 hypothetical protein [Streptomyces lunaelactis]NUK25465.1 hypothetical protein [Streptomyces lunaelactis]
MSVTDHRRLGAAVGAALLTLAVAGCSGLGRNAVGTISYGTERDALVTVSNPSVNGCHRLAPSGATVVVNNTMIDMVLYRNRDCSGSETIYLPTTLTDSIVPGAQPWRSYTLVH